MNAYTALTKQTYTLGDHALVPLWMDDRYHIMQWRNEQLYHLRQEKPLTNEDQDTYFARVIAPLFAQDRPDQLLFSYLENGRCIGYGGLVHINWAHQHAEVSFIMATELEKTAFDHHWSTFLTLLYQVAFDEVQLHKLFTYAYDLRPHLYKVLEANGFTREAVLREHSLIDGHYKDVVIHALLAQHRPL